jgi:hypothetical protein
MMMNMQIMIEHHMVLVLNPSSHAGFENERSQIHRLVNLSKAVAKMVHGIPMSAKIAKIHAIHKNKIKSGVKIKFDSGLM